MDKIFVSTLAVSLAVVMSGVEKVMLWLCLFIRQAGNSLFHESPWLVLIVIIHQEQSQNVHSVVNGLFDIIRAAQGLKTIPFLVCRCVRSCSLHAGSHWSPWQRTAALIY